MTRGHVCAFCGEPFSECSCDVACLDCGQRLSDCTCGQRKKFRYRDRQYKSYRNRER